MIRVVANNKCQLVLFNCTVPEMNLLSSSDISVTKNPNIEDFWSLETIGITDSWDVTDDDKAS